MKEAEFQPLVNNLTQLFADDFRHAVLASHVMTQANYNGNGETLTLKLDAEQFREFIHALKEEDVYRLKHPDDFANRPPAN